MGLLVEQRFSPEEDVDDAITSVVGIGVIIIASRLSGASDEDLLLTVAEKNDKPVTDKRAGLRGIPQETVKVEPILEGFSPESPLSTLQGALLEEIGGSMTDFNRIVFDRGRHEIPLSTLPGKKGGIEIVLYGGDPDRLLPFEESEVDAFSWMTADTFLGGPNRRRTSIDLVDGARSRGLLSRQNWGKTQQVFPVGFNSDAFLRRRATIQDITQVVK